MAVDVIVGLQRGDEGKGRFVDLIAANYDIIARGNGGANAGHTIMPEGLEPMATHQLPSGIAYPGKLNVIAAGVFLDPVKLEKEITEAKSKGYDISNKTLLISTSAHMVMPHHILLDELRESGEKAQGSTKSGIAYVAADKYTRSGVRVEDVEDLGLEERKNLAISKMTEAGVEVNEDMAQAWAKSIDIMTEYFADTGEVVRDYLAKGKNVLAEGAQAFWLDVSHGMYPYTTSSSTTVYGLLDGLEVSPRDLGKVMGVAKIIKSHVGDGPCVTEITDTEVSGRVRGEQGKFDSEFGASTGRPRRIGYPDLVEINTAVKLNGVDEVYLTKLDHFPRYGNDVKVADSYTLDNKTIKVAPSSASKLGKCKPQYISVTSWSEELGDEREFRELPKAAQDLILKYEDFLGVKVAKVGVGPHRNQVINR